MPPDRQTLRGLAWVLASLLLSTSTPVTAEDVLVPLVLEGDSIAGIGTVERINGLAINDRGDWHVEVDTDHPDVDRELVLLRNGEVALRKGDPLGDLPSDVQFGFFDHFPLNNLGQSVLNTQLVGNVTIFDNTALFAMLDTSLPFSQAIQLMTREGDAAPGVPGDTFQVFSDFHINDHGAILGLTELGKAGQVLYTLTTDPVTGGITSSEIIAAEGDVLPGQTAEVVQFWGSQDLLGFNDSGQVLFVADIANPPSEADALYFYDGSNLVKIAQEGDPAPYHPGEWTWLNSSKVALNDRGDILFIANRIGNHGWLLRNEVPVAVIGESVPAIFPNTLTGFGTGPVALTRQGEALWVGTWVENVDTEKAIFLEQEILIRETVTEVPSIGLRIDELVDETEGYAVSDNGLFLIFEAVLEDGRSGAFLLDRSQLFADGFESGDTLRWSDTLP